MNFVNLLLLSRVYGRLCDPKPMLYEYVAKPANAQELHSDASVHMSKQFFSTFWGYILYLFYYAIVIRVMKTFLSPSIALLHPEMCHYSCLGMNKISWARICFHNCGCDNEICEYDKANPMKWLKRGLSCKNRISPATSSSPFIHNCLMHASFLWLMLVSEVTNSIRFACNITSFTITQIRRYIITFSDTTVQFEREARQLLATVQNLSNWQTKTACVAARSVIQVCVRTVSVLSQII